MSLKTTSAAAWVMAAALSSGLAPSAAQAQPSGADRITAACGSCHLPDKNGKVPRISDIRKSPEGWDMVMSRMERWHGVQVTEANRAAIVKYLSDTQGLAPSEAEPFRYALEQRPGYVEQRPDAELGEMCGRCHTVARVGLQRRDAAEWKRLINTHVGQWPTLEFQFMSRDRDWWTIANTTLKDKLAKTWGFASTAWDKWKGHATPAITGTWVVSGHQPGKGDYTGTMTVTGGQDDRFSVAYDLVYGDGTKVAAQGKSVVFTGYEWRGTATIAGKDVREVFKLSADGSQMSGRWFDVVNDELGADVTAVKADGKASLVSVQPAALKAGKTSTVAVVGDSLSGDVKLGAGVKVVKAQPQPWGLAVTVEVAADAKPGQRDVTVGGTRLDKAVAVYDKVDTIKVEPPYTIARVGGGSGPVPAHYAQFEAVGYLNGKDGKPGTKDDVRLGTLPAHWVSDDFDEASKALEDAKFAGTIDDKGLFTPGVAGPNPQRVYKTNNVGNLKVTATADDGKGGTVSGDGQLIVTVQRWVDAWIR